MKVIFHHGYDANDGEQSYGAADLVNLEEPIIRKGGIPFRNCYEIEEYLRFALDRIAVIPPPETLAREIALLNHGLRDPGNVEPVRARLAASIAETMSDWGLEPTVEETKP